MDMGHLRGHPPWAGVLLTSGDEGVGALLCRQEAEAHKGGVACSVYTAGRGGSESEMPMTFVPALGSRVSQEELSLKSL